MRRAFALLLLAPPLLSAADPVATARAEAEAAERESRRLERLAEQARGDAERLRAGQDAAAQGIIAAEAALAAAEVRSAELVRRLARARAELAAQQRPAALLLAGMAQLGRRPPLLSIADGASPAEFIQVRALLDTTVPELDRRTSGLRAALTEADRLSAQARTAEAELRSRRADLAERQQRFAELERAANRRLAQLGGEALLAGDEALALASEARRLAGSADAERGAGRLAATLAALPPAPPRPSAPEDRPERAPLSWHLPLTAPLQTGLAEISPSGVRSRGLTFRTGRGAAVRVPAAGRVAFAGPFRRHAGVVILDHGGGWMTLMTGVRTAHEPGTRVAAGDPLGRALGPVTVELSRNGRAQPAALIARSSVLLSNGRAPS